MHAVEPTGRIHGGFLNPNPEWKEPQLAERRRFQIPEILNCSRYILKSYDNVYVVIHDAIKLYGTDIGLSHPHLGV